MKTSVSIKSINRLRAINRLRMIRIRHWIKILNLRHIKCDQYVFNLNEYHPFIRLPG